MAKKEKKSGKPQSTSTETDSGGGGALRTFLLIFLAIDAGFLLFVGLYFGLAHLAGYSGKDILGKGDQELSSPAKQTPSIPEPGGADGNGDNQADSTPTANVETSAPEETQVPQAESSGNLGDYHVEIKDAKLAQDYEGKPAIIITYSWTNNSEETTSAAVALIEEAFQDGVQLESAIVSDSNVYNSENYMKEIRPGITLDVQTAYILTSDTSTVEFEVSEFMSFSDGIVTKNFDLSALS